MSAGVAAAQTPEERRALLAELLRQKGGPVRRFPLSFSQQRLWFLDRMDPGSTAYTITSALRMRGEVDVAALERAVGALVERHESLRTVFRVVDGVPAQVVLPLRQVRVPVEDASAPEASRGERALALVAEEMARPFDLAAGPVFRTRLFRQGEDDHLLVFAMHHIVSDGWSMGVLYRDFCELYAAHSEGREPALPVLPIQYADFSVWQRGYLQGPTLERQLAFWRRALAGAPALLELPLDRPRPALQTDAGGVLALRLPPPVLDSARTLAREGDTTLFMALLTVFAVLMARWSGAEDVVVGTPTANRSREETEGLIGFFLNTLPLRVALAGDPSFRDAMARVRETALGAYSHQDVPFERLVDELKVPRSLSHAPLFQVMFVLHTEPVDGIVLGPLALELVEPEAQATAQELSFSMRERQGRLELDVEYNRDLFDRSTVERMAEHFVALVHAAAADLEAPVSRLPMLSARERAEVVARWNPAPSAFSAVPVHALVSAQASASPGAVAVVCGSDEITYGELDARASRLARVLRSAGVGVESRVGLSMERSAALLVAIVGVWKAGAAYVPVDPAYPAERRAYMLADGGVRVVLTDAASVDDLPAVDAEVVVVDRLPLASDGAASHAENAEGAEDAEGIDARAGVDARDGVDARLAVDVTAGVDALPEVDPDALAYVIYTSGSTGRPKGVMVPHRGVVNFLESMAREPGVGAGDVLVSVTSLSFDIAVLELLLPLTVGARVVVATREEAMEGRRLARLLDASGATVMQATPATWRLLVQSGWAGRPEMVALSGGEALAPELARDLLPRCRALWNLYGPTETTIWSTAHRVAEAERIPLGTPIANTTLYVVDGAGEPAPIGVPGELWIGGAGVVRGYLDRPALTAERFVPDPFGAVGGRLYRTGDRVRRRVDGSLEFLGRIDFQVKVRGFRIELGEIETALQEQPGIREAVVVVREDTPGDARIVAYPVFDGAPPSPDALRAALAARLPEHMLPSAYVPLAALPLTPNGKTDRAALPAPDAAAAAAPGDRLPPRTPAEKAIAEIWAGVLGTDAFGADSNFFAVGGHSLLLAQVHARLEARLGREVPLVDLFRHPTIATLAAFVGEVPPAPSPEDAA